MTTIVTNKQSMACDLQFTHSNGSKFKGLTKILQVPEPVSQELWQSKNTLIGFAGRADEIGDLVRWFCTMDGKPPKTREVEMLMLSDKKGIFHGNHPRSWLKINAPYYSIGSGSKYALGAMESGKTPLESVKIASKHDLATGMGFKEYFL